MIGTFVNVGTIIAGSLIGGLVKKVLKEEYNNCLFTAMGLASIGLGMNSVVQNMPDSKYPVLFVASLALGSLIGTIIDIDGRVGRLTKKNAAAGEKATTDKPPEGSAALGEKKKGSLGEGIVTASLLYCIGTLSILGPVQSALYQDYTFLFTNATLDLVTAMIFAATYGVGMIFAAGILFAWQGSIYGLTILLGNFITDTMMTELSIVGGFLIMSSGLAILNIKDCKTLNLLPALIVPVVWCLIVG